MDVLTLLLAIGLVGRLTILVTRDVITEKFRLWFTNMLGSKQVALDFITCHWCVSVWVSGAASPFAYYMGDTLWFIIPATIATTSFAASLLADR